MSVSHCSTHEPPQVNNLPSGPNHNTLLCQNLVKTFQNLPPENKEKVCDAIVEEIAKPETNVQLQSEIKKLAYHATTVDGAFGSVRSGLKMLDNQNVKDKHGRPIPKFHPRWVEFQNVSLT